MRIASWAVLFALAALVGCTDGSVKLMKFADETCACKDAECVRGVLAEVAAFRAEHRRVRGDQERANQAAEKLGKCAIERGLTGEEVMMILNRPVPAKAP